MDVFQLRGFSFDDIYAWEVKRIDQAGQFWFATDMHWAAFPLSLSVLAQGQTASVRIS